MASAVPSPMSDPAPSPLSPVKEIPVFEFTKRKRWADLLVTELNDAVILVLSATCQVWYCGNAVTELLGWRDDELVDGDLTDLMNANDKANFRDAFKDSLRTKTEMLVYARLQCKNEFYVSSNYTSAPREVLFEIRGRPHSLPDTNEFKCYFAMAQPYPSRNTAMLNTILELKMENERLQQRVAQLRDQNQALDSSSESVFPPVEIFSAVEGARSTSFELGGGSLATDLEEDGPRKKVKRLAAEQHVCFTCGRTDSPEWRKGPNGPKTLCNACGLRWAKRARRSGEEGEAETPTQSGNNAAVF